MRGTSLERWPQRRREATVDVDGHAVRVKVAAGRVKVEHDDAVAAAEALGCRCGRCSCRRGTRLGRQTERAADRATDHQCDSPAAQSRRLTSTYNHTSAGTTVTAASPNTTISPTSVARAPAASAIVA